MKSRIASFFVPITLLEWGGILLYFYLSGRVSAFLHPSFRPQVFIAGLMLVFCAIVLLLTRKQTAICECGIVENCPEASRSPLLSSWIFPFILLLPLGIAALYSRDSYGVNILTTRGITENVASLPGLADRMKKSFPSPAASVVEPALPDSDSPPVEDPTAANFFKPNAAGNIELNVADLLYAAQEPSMRTPFVGKSAEIVGQFMPAKTNNPLGNRFKLVRLYMNCCAADAQPISLLVEYSDPLPATVTEMAWTRVVGDIEFLMENGRTTAVLRARKVESIDPPEESMLY